MTTKPKIGLLVTGLLEDEYNKTGHIRPKCAEVTSKLADILSAYGEIVNPGFVEYEPDAERVAQIFNANSVDLIIVIETSYQKGAIVMRAVLGTQAPLLVWNTQQIRYLPEDADFDLIMLNFGMGGIPELTNSLMRTGRRFGMITSHVADPNGLAQVSEYAHAAGAVRKLRSARVGFVGHTYEGMTDLMTDQLSLREKIGPICWPIEPEKVADAAAKIPTEKVKGLIDEDRGRYNTKALSPDVFERSARLALALEQVVRDYRVDALATFEHAWLNDPNVGIIPNYAVSRLISMGIPSAPEGDVPTVVAMLLLQELAGQATVLENYVMDFDHNTIILSHDGTGNPALASNSKDVSLKPSIYYRGLHGFGAGLEFAYAPGDVTIVSLTPLGNGNWRLIAAEGESLPMKPRPVAAPQMTFRYSGGGIQEYCNRWCLAGAFHHMALAYGRQAKKVQRVAELLGIDSVII